MRTPKTSATATVAKSEKKKPNVRSAPKPPAPSKKTGIICQIKRGVRIERHQLVKVTMLVPARIVPLLDRWRYDERLVKLPAAEVSASDFSGHRMRWNNEHEVVRQIVRPRKFELERMLAEGPDKRITTVHSAESWRYIQRLAKALKITPGDWLLSASGYAAFVAEREVAK